MYKFTDKELEVHNVEINLRHESKTLTDEFGINVLYIRNCKFVRCKCFDDLNKTGDPNCKLCFGTGHFASIEKIQAIESSNSAYSSDNSITQLPIGATDQKNEVYYIDGNEFIWYDNEHCVVICGYDKNNNTVEIADSIDGKVTRDADTFFQRYEDMLSQAVYIRVK